MNSQEIEKIYRDEPRFQRVFQLKHVQKYSTYAVASIINWLVEKMNPQYCYLDVGVWHGFSLLAGAIGNPQKRCIGVDNFSQTDGIDDLERNIEPFENVEFFKMGYQKYLQQIHKQSIGVYHYDADHREDSQYYGLTLAKRFLREGSIIIVDDWSWLHVQTATRWFLKDNPEYHIIFEETYNKPIEECDLWNGICLIKKGKEGRAYYGY